MSGAASYRSGAAPEILANMNTVAFFVYSPHLRRICMCQGAAARRPPSRAAVSLGLHDVPAREPDALNRRDGLAQLVVRDLHAELLSHLGGDRA